MRYAQMRPYDISNGPGVRATLFVTGCTHKCSNCFNEEYQDFSAGEEWTSESEDKFIKYISDPNVVGVNILGGEPLQQLKDDSLLNLLIRIKKEFPKKTIWLWTGYVFEEFMMFFESERFNRAWKILKNVDVLIDGRYEEELKDIRLKYRGSSNQRVINMKEYFKGKGIVIMEV